MIAILGIGDDQVQGLKHLGSSLLTQVLDLLNAHCNIRLLAGDPSDRNRSNPTPTTLRHPGQL